MGRPQITSSHVCLLAGASSSSGRVRVPALHRTGTSNSRPAPSHGCWVGREGEEQRKSAAPGNPESRLGCSNPRGQSKMPCSCRCDMAASAPPWRRGSPTMRPPVPLVHLRAGTAWHPNPSRPALLLLTRLHPPVASDGCWPRHEGPMWRGSRRTRRPVDLLFAQASRGCIDDISGAHQSVPSCLSVVRSASGIDSLPDSTSTWPSSSLCLQFHRLFITSSGREPLFMSCLRYRMYLLPLGMRGTTLGTCR